MHEFQFAFDMHPFCDRSAVSKLASKYASSTVIFCSSLFAYGMILSIALTCFPPSVPFFARFARSSSR